ncbi:MAG: hypothetical protein ACTHJ8_01200 [Mucilaginibacter sp.]|jgi:hypothetical protein
MDNKFFYLYLAGAIVALTFCIYRLVVIKQTDFRVAIDAIAFVLFCYMAYKVKREKQDKDLM